MLLLGNGGMGRLGDLPKGTHEISGRSTNWIRSLEPQPVSLPRAHLRPVAMANLSTLRCAHKPPTWRAKGKASTLLLGRPQLATEQGEKSLTAISFMD